MIRWSAILPHIISYAIVAIAFFIGGIWVQSQRTPVLPKPVTQYLPNFGQKYLDLPDFRYPTYSFVTIEKKELHVRVDTIKVPVEIERVIVLPTDAVRLNSKYLFLKKFDTQSGEYIIDQYTVPKPNFTHSIRFVALTNPLIEPMPLYAGLSADLSYKRFGVTGQALFNTLGEPLVLAGISIKLF